jgi:hypothetical protein
MGGRSLCLVLAVSAAACGAGTAAAADPPIWDPAGSAQGIAATAQGAASDPAALTATSTASDCTTQAKGAVSPTPPPDDPFYTPPAAIPDGAPGTVIRIRPMCIGDLQIPVPYRAWDVMYVTTAAEDADGNPSELNAVRSVATGLIIEPLNVGPTVKRPLVAFTTPQDSDSTLQAPSYVIAQGSNSDNATIQPALAQGWDVMFADYEGPDSAYGAGVLEGHAVLDGIRAAESLSATDGLDGVRTRVGMWGYSGGAIAVAHASELQPRYAPELNIAGVTEGGVPADIHSTFDAINNGYLAPGLAFAASVGVNAAYPNLLPMSLLNDAGKALAAHMRATGDSSYPTSYPPQKIQMYTVCGCNPMDLPQQFPQVADLVRTLDLGQHIPTAPLFVYHDWNDELIPFAGVAKLVKTYCDGGAIVDFRVNFGDEHVSNAVVGAPEAMAYLTARFDGATPVDTCSLPDNGGVNPPVDPVPLPPPLPQVPPR